MNNHLDLHSTKSVTKDFDNINIKDSSNGKEDQIVIDQKLSKISLQTEINSKENGQLNLSTTDSTHDIDEMKTEMCTYCSSRLLSCCQNCGCEVHSVSKKLDNSEDEKKKECKVSSLTSDDLDKGSSHSNLDCHHLSTSVHPHCSRKICGNVFCPSKMNPSPSELSIPTTSSSSSSFISSLSKINFKKQLIFYRQQYLANTPLAVELLKSHQGHKTVSLLKEKQKIKQEIQNLDRCEKEILHQHHQYQQKTKEDEKENTIMVIEYDSLNTNQTKTEEKKMINSDSNGSCPSHYTQSKEGQFQFKTSSSYILYQPRTDICVECKGWDEFHPIYDDLEMEEEEINEKRKSLQKTLSTMTTTSSSSTSTKKLPTKIFCAHCGGRFCHFSAHHLPYHHFCKGCSGIICWRCTMKCPNHILKKK